VALHLVASRVVLIFIELVRIFCITKLNFVIFRHTITFYFSVYLITFFKRMKHSPYSQAVGRPPMWSSGQSSWL
jgi:hypothetical protein